MCVYYDRIHNNNNDGDDDDDGGGDDAAERKSRLVPTPMPKSRHHRFNAIRVIGGLALSRCEFVFAIWL